MSCERLNFSPPLGGPDDLELPGRMRVLTTHQADEWNAVLARCRHDCYHGPAFHRFSENRDEGRAIFAVYDEGEYTVGLPLLVREIDGRGEVGRLRDATSVYGYAGPVASHELVPRNVIGGFQEALREILERERVVCVFSRLHPLLPQAPLIDGLGECRPGGRTVSVDLTLPPEAQWSGYRKSHRRGVRKLQEMGAETFHDAELRHLDEFVEIYLESMDRVAATNAYYFDRSYFADLFEALGSQLFLLLTRVDGRIVAGGIYIEGGGFFQAHLGGMRAEFSRIGPTKIVDDYAREFGCRRGLHTLHLGGGVGSEEDSLFQYKAGFSDLRHEFQTWRWIFEPEAYQRLCNRPGSENSKTTFFPAYRAPSIKTAESSISERLLTTGDGEEWRDALPIHRSVFGSVELARIFERHRGVGSRLFVLRNGIGELAYPLRLRPIAPLPFVAQEMAGLHDVITPKYCGPMFRDVECAILKENFASRLGALCRREGIVSTFAHLHPWHASVACLRPGTTEWSRQIVYVDVTKSDEQLRKESFSDECRKNLNCAETAGIRVFAAASARDLEEFHRIYTGTMERSLAGASCHFSMEFFADIARELPHNATFLLAEHKGRTVAATLFLHDETDMYAYLGGADPEFQDLRPSYAVIAEAIGRARSAGNRRLVLDGGYRPDDGIFRFQSSFSPLRADFSVAKRVHKPGAFDALCTTWRSFHADAPLEHDYFPPYRAQPRDLATP